MRPVRLLVGSWPTEMQLVLGVVLLLTTSGLSAQEMCVGDCNGDKEVDVAEMVLGVDIALAYTDVGSCEAMDADSNGTVAVDELVTAVSNGLHHCSPPVRTTTPTPTPTPISRPEIGEQRCALKEDSTISLFVSAIPLPLVVNPSGSIDLRCGSLDEEGNAFCTCGIESFEPIVLLGVGTVCIEKGPPCPEAAISCEAGKPLDIDVVANADIGFCASNSACESSCSSECEQTGKVRLESGCIGFCNGGEEDGQECRRDGDCPGGFCNGLDPVQATNTCQCQCIDSNAGEPGPAGDMQCQIGLSVRVEVAAPCDRTDISFEIGSACVPTTTGMASSQIFNANGVDGLQLPTDGPASTIGQAIECSALENGTTGLEMAGAVNFFSSTLGDAVITLLLQCE